MITGEAYHRGCDFLILDCNLEALVCNKLGKLEAATKSQNIDRIFYYMSLINFITFNSATTCHCVVRMYCVTVYCLL